MARPLACKSPMAPVLRPRLPKPNKTLTPTVNIALDYAVGPHTASLGLTFAEGNTLPAQFKECAFIGQHGSWNRKPHSGYKVIFVPLRAGEPAGGRGD